MKQVAEQIQGELELRYRTTLTIIGVQVFIVVGLTIIAWFAAGRSDSSIKLGASGITTILWVAILVVAIGAFLLRRVIFSPAVLRDTAVLRGASGLLKNLQGKTLLLAGLGEVIAIVGFIVSFLSGDAFDMLRAAAVSLIVFFISFPRKAAWQRVLQAASK